MHTARYVRYIRQSLFEAAMCATVVMGSAIDQVGIAGIVTEEQPNFVLRGKQVPDDADGGDWFGQAVAVDGDLLVVGAIRDEDAGVNAGSGYVFRRNEESWSQEHKLTASDTASGDAFGISIAISGERIAVGAPLADPSGRSNAGAAYVFRRTSSGWLQEQKLVASDGNFHDLFGSSVAIAGETLVVGAPAARATGFSSGAAYAYQLVGSSWVFVQKLTAADTNLGDAFGSSLAIEGDVLLIGAPQKEVNGVPSGSVYTFRHLGELWSEEQKLVADDARFYDQFGFAIAVDRSVAVIGSVSNLGNVPYSGAAYVFRHDGTQWNQEQKLIVPDAESGDELGQTVGVDGDTIVLGAPGHDEGPRDGLGAAYVFRMQSAGWIQSQMLIPDDGERLSRFASGLGFLDDTLVVGARGDNEVGFESGSAYIYQQNRDESPVADAGDDAEAECTSAAGATLLLDGTRSSDDIVLFEWFEDFGGASPVLLGTGETLEVGLALGDHVITLRVTDESEATDTDEVVKTVLDTVPPEISIGVNLARLWPPNHRLVDVLASVVATDACGTTSVALCGVTSSEPDDAPGAGDGHTVNDIQEAVPGTADTAVALRAERDGAGQGRAYTITYRASDDAGNATQATTAVLVPHDLGGLTDPAHLEVSGNDVRWQAVPGADRYSVIRAGLESLHLDGDIIRVGPALCLAAGVTQTSVLDPVLPAPDRAFIYLVEYTLDGGNSGYGAESAGRARVVTSTDECCP